MGKTINLRWYVRFRAKVQQNWLPAKAWDPSGKAQDTIMEHLYAAMNTLQIK